MKTILSLLCSLVILGTLFLLLKRSLEQSRRKTSLYKHKSELEITPQSYAIKEDLNKEPEADAEWGEKLDER
ncbi:MAG: hypothetical protein AAFR87_30450 [Bacteroidota bacterium]